MLLRLLGVSFHGLLFTVTGSCFVAELAGYWLHRLLHSERFPALSRGHLIHHFHIYGPKDAMRADKYREATDNRFSVGNVGIEWLAPSGLIFGLCWGVMIGLHVPHTYQFIAAVTLVVWPVFTFNYLHDRMHLRDFWMARTPLLKRWFIQARRLHDIHHRSLNDPGRMDSNFGIGFYFFDRIFRTISHRHHPFNSAGYRAAQQRYSLDQDFADDTPAFPSGFRVCMREARK